MDCFLYECFNTKGIRTDDFNAILVVIATPVPVAKKSQKKQAQEAPKEDSSPEIKQPTSVDFVFLLKPCTNNASNPSVILQIMKIFYKI